MAAIGEVEDFPNSKVKFLCGHGGKILPRPADGKLKYVGGETRLVVVPRNINFTELMNKLSSIFGGDTVLKYQLMTEDLDALVTVKNDDDLRFMLDEYDRHTKSPENGENTKLRAFLFPSDPTVIENQASANGIIDNNAIEQRYIDAINGVVRSSSTNTIRPSFSIASSCGSSPRSTGPDVYAPEFFNHDMFSQNGFRREMHRVRSSPSNLCNLSHQLQHTHSHHHHHHQQSPEQLHPYSHWHHHQQQSPEQQHSYSNHQRSLEQKHPYSHHQHSLEQQQQQQHQPSGVLRFHGPCNGGNGRLPPVPSVGQSEISRSQMGGHIRTRYYSPNRECRHERECTVCRNEGFDIRRWNF